ncbi:MAG: hypothetical protein LBV12_00440 [Puniceicoccales bacterium]|jgi:hypothetical protein|nr:hypothetical protein [Puniceicoccales bacterium]
MSIKYFTCLASAALLALSACKEEEKVVTYSIPKEKPSTVDTDASVSATPVAPPMQPDSTMLAQQDNFSQPSWTPPSHWKEDPPRPMRKGSWTISAKGSDVAGEMTVTVFPGDVGGDLANVNRWRRQINLPPTDGASLTNALQPITVDSLPGKIITIEGSDKTIIGVILPREGATWFFKYTGDKAAARAEHPSINAFIQTVSFSKK